MKNLILVTAIAVMVLSPIVGAQAPTSPGEAGVICFIERVGGVADVFIAIIPAAIPAGTPSGPLPGAATVAVPLGGLVAPGSNRRGQQSPKESGFLIVQTPTGPIVFVNTVNAAGVPLLESIDFRAGAASLVVTTLGGTAGPYDLLDDSANQRIIVSTLSAGGAATAWGVSYAGAISPVPTQGPYIGAAAPTPYAERMAIDPLTGNVLMPTLITVEMLDATLALAAAVVMPAGQTVATNIETAFNGGVAANCLVGTVAPGLATGGWTAFNGLGAAQSGLFPASPAGTFRPAPGFTEIGLVSNAAGSTATFVLADSLALPLGPGVVVQLVNEAIPTVPGAVLVNPASPVPAGSPFGNPTDTEPCYFMVSGIPDSIGAVGTGGAWSYAGFSLGLPPGQPAPTATLGAFIDPAHVGRPQALAGVGFPATIPAVAICESAVATAQVEIFPLAAAPAFPLVQPAFGAPIVAPLGPGAGQGVSTRFVTLGTSQLGTIPAGPIFAQGFTIPGLVSLNQLGAQLAAPPAAPVVAPAIPNFVASLALPAGGFVQPPAPVAGLVGVRDPAFVYNGPFLWSAVAESLATGFTRVTVHGTGAFGFAQYAYASPVGVPSTLVTEIVTL